jgi:FkbM family methyltransferase
VAGVSRLIQEGYRYLAGTRLRYLRQLPLVAGFKNRMATWVRQWDLTRDVHGVKLTMPGWFLNYYTDNFEPSTLKWLQGNLRPGMIVADVGAHIGFVTVFMAHLVGPSGRVYAFEPAANNLAYLNRNIAGNEVENVVVVPRAAGDVTATRTLYLAEGSDMYSLHRHPLSGPVGSIAVEQVRLEDMVSAVDLAKIDVEGAEIEVLRGMERILGEEKRPILLVEWSPACQVAAGHPPDELIIMLRGLGYEPKALGDGDPASVDETLHRLERGELPREWYVNLLCLPGSR